MVSFRTFRRPYIFPRPVSWLGLFYRFLQENGSSLPENLMTFSFASLFGLILKDSEATSKCVYIHFECRYICTDISNYKEKVQLSSKGKKEKEE